jgi:hypothetical protein
MPSAMELPSSKSGRAVVACHDTQTHASSSRHHRPAAHASAPPRHRLPRIVIAAPRCLPHQPVPGTMKRPPTPIPQPPCVTPDKRSGSPTKVAAPPGLRRPAPLRWPLRYAVAGPRLGGGSYRDGARMGRVVPTGDYRWLRHWWSSPERPASRSGQFLWQQPRPLGGAVAVLRRGSQPSALRWWIPGPVEVPEAGSTDRQQSPLAAAGRLPDIEDPPRQRPPAPVETGLAPAVGNPTPLQMAEPPDLDPTSGHVGSQFVEQP